MMKTILMLAGVMVLLGLGVIFFRQKNITPFSPETSLPKSGTPTLVKTWTEQESEQAARNFVLTSPTYHFDGSDLVLKSTVPLYCGNSCWEFTYTFQSNHAGYGNRAGKMLAEVMTPHQIAVTLQNGQITQAMTDGTFNELTAAVK